ncbi:ubiquitin-like protein ISG15 [Neosynchiropus ocellatus]
MEIVISLLDGRSEPLVVNPTDTVADLKLRIQTKLNIPVYLQKLVFVNGTKTPLCDDSRTLGSYGLRSGSHVSLLVVERTTFQVFLRRDTGTSTYDVTADETVADFKLKVERRERVPVSQQNMVCEGRTMTSGKLSDYNVRENSTIDLNLRLRGG